MLRWWPVALIVALQLGALALLPRSASSARTSGSVITLRTRAVDPFDPLAGRFVVLRYRAEEAPADADVRALEGPADVWLRVARGEDGLWTGVAVELEPGPATATERSLRATWDGRRTELVGAGRLYLPEEECLAADAILRERPGEGEVDLAVDASGNVSPLRLRLEGEVFEP